MHCSFLLILPVFYLSAELSGEDAEKVQKMLDALDDCDDVQDVYTNADLPEDDEE